MERLKSRKQIQALFSGGRQFSHFPFRVYWLPENPQVILQAGVGVSNRLFGKAVDRNRIKRLMRESWRINKQPLWSHLHANQKRLSVFIIYTGNTVPAFEELSVKMKGLVSRLQTNIDALDKQAS